METRCTLNCVDAELTRRTVKITALGLACFLSAFVAGNPDSFADEPGNEAPLFSHWKFDEEGDVPVVHDSSDFANTDITVPHRLARTRGVHGAALDLVGENKLACRFASDAAQLSEITIAVWTRPTDLRGYREIFRQECDERLLFSYQNDGSVLSLGLNVGGYVECDARIDSAQVLDGAWHHCAATFDGQAMRVYLDGKEIGSLPRSGQIALRTSAPAFIGSSSGQGEFFQGGLDDLRIYAKGLTPEEISRLYRNGTESLVNYAKQIDAKLGTLCRSSPAPDPP